MVHPSHGFDMWGAGEGAGLGVPCESVSGEEFHQSVCLSPFEADA